VFEISAEPFALPLRNRLRRSQPAAAVAAIPL
jgi:hypothetical protein